MRVVAPFGRQRLTGYVVGMTRRVDENLRLKVLEDFPDSRPAVSRELLKLTRWVADYYHASWGEAIKAAIPPGLEAISGETYVLTETGEQILAQGTADKLVLPVLRWIAKNPRAMASQARRVFGNKVTRLLAIAMEKTWVKTSFKLKKTTAAYITKKKYKVLGTDFSQEEIEKLLARSPKQKRIYGILREGEKTLSELLELETSPHTVLRRLCEKGLVEAIEVRVERFSKRVINNVAEKEAFQFTPDQEKVYRKLSNSLKERKFSVHLLHGVTGSGKTEIYIRCVESAIALGKQAIIMTPEISLTPQMASLFRRRFGDHVAILHSGLSNIERYLEWKKIRQNQVFVAVGARSAVFAPFDNLGLIVIDEEHDTSYKQDTSPRYHARDTAVIRAQNANATVILGSATPSMESRRNAETGKYSYLILKKRVLNRLLPLVDIIDMRKERSERKNFSMLSIKLQEALWNRLKKGEQVFLFLNRRGVANYVLCQECGYVFYCDRCSVSLTFHRKENLLRCHYCNFAQRIPNFCTDCMGGVIKFQGFGTQKLEEEIHRLFQGARTFRLDRDTARKYADFESVFRKVRSGQIDILIGTQMITKGHDFPNVTLVGVISADISLNIPDFRSAERTFQLLTQVSGRAGRGDVPGRVVIQTSNPDHYVHEWTRMHNYEGFYEKELYLRRKLNYPPFTRLAGLEVECSDEKLGRRWMKKLEKLLGDLVSQKGAIEMIGPAPAMIYLVNNRFRWKLILRAKTARCLIGTLDSEDLVNFLKSVPHKVKLIVDMDPVNLL